MPAYILKNTGNGREGYLESQAQEYAAKIERDYAAHKAAVPTFTIWGVECPILFGSSSICIAANSEGFQAMDSTESAKKTGMEYACFQTKDWSRSSVENAVFEWATKIARLGGCWE